MSTSKFSKTDFFREVANLESAPQHLRDFARAELTKIQDKNDARAAKKAQESAPQDAADFDAIVEALRQNGQGMTAAEITKATGVSTARIPAVVKKMGDGIVETQKQGSKPNIYLLTEQA